MSRNYDNWERLVAAAIKKEQFRQMALAPPSSESSSGQSDLISFASADLHVRLAGASPGGDAAPFDFRAENYLGQLERFSLRKLQVATDKFSNKNIVGRGGFADVYKGKLADGTLVAIKRLTKNHNQDGDLHFKFEVETISLAVHRNLLKLRGFCVTSTEKLLVYPYMANGSVASCLRERPESQLPLDWTTRKLIARGAARGVAYLHDRSLPIIHCDIKAANILLDKDFEAIVGDFGLAKLMDHEETDVVTAVSGTFGHIAPEYFSTGKVSRETDVYAYGVMLLELVTGQRACDLARLANEKALMLLDWVKEVVREKKLERLVDSDLKSGYIEQEVEELIQVALMCTKNSPYKRPMMSDVVLMLQRVGLADRAAEEEEEKEEEPSREFKEFWIIADSMNIQADELSGPR